MPEKPLYPISFFRTNDLEKTRTFYKEILQLPIALDQSECVIYLIGEYGYWGFCQTYEEIQKPEQICITLVVDTREQVDEWHTHLQEKGVEIKKEPKSRNVIIPWLDGSPEKKVRNERRVGKRS